MEHSLQSTTTVVILGINHVTLSVSNVPSAIAFYEGVLGLHLRAKWRDGAYLTAGDHWICLNVDNLPHSAKSAHIAFDVSESDFESLRAKIIDSGAPTWRTSVVEGQSHYFEDPYGNRLEIHVGSLESRLKAMQDGSWPELVIFE